MKKENTGQRLNREWCVNAEHALFSSTGRTYNPLKRFPGALFDEDGFVVFAAKQEYERSPYLSIKKKVTVPGRIKQIPNYKNKPLDAILKSFEKDLANSLKDTPARRQKRLASAKKQPIQKEVTTSVFLRNPDVVAEVIHRAGGICEQCKRKAPFKRRKDGSPYLEVHHLVLLANGGEDSIQNAVAVCPNCHRKAHFG